MLTIEWPDCIENDKQHIRSIQVQAFKKARIEHSGFYIQSVEIKKSLAWPDTQY
jgi:hypothetical protein